MQPFSRVVLGPADCDFKTALLPIDAAFWPQLGRDRLPAKREER